MNNVDCSRIPGHRTQPPPSSPFHVQPVFHPFLLFTLTLCVITPPFPSSFSLSPVLICSLSHYHPFQLFDPSLSSSTWSPPPPSPWPFSSTLPLCSPSESIKKLFTVIFFFLFPPLSVPGFQSWVLGWFARSTKVSRSGCCLCRSVHLLQCTHRTSMHAFMSCRECATQISACKM